MSTTPFLSIVIPAFNEARRIPRTLDRLIEHLQQQPYSWEIVVVSNGSTDDTAVIVKRYASSFPGVRLLETNQRGKGIATKIGVLATAGAVVFLCDADMSMPPQWIDAFIDELQRYDVVAGSREAHGARRFDEPPHRHLMGRVFNKVVQLLAVPGVDDTQCGFKAFRRATADDLFPRQTITGWGFDVELLYLARKLGHSIVELPIDWYFDSDTRVRPGIDSVAMLLEVLMIRVRDRIGAYQSKPSPSAPERDVV